MELTFKLVKLGPHCIDPILSHYVSCTSIRKQAVGIRLKCRLVVLHSATLADTFTVELIAWRKFTQCPVMDTFLLFLTMYLSRQPCTTDTSHFCKFASDCATLHKILSFPPMQIPITCTKDLNIWTNSRTIQLRGKPVNQ